MKPRSLKHQLISRISRENGSLVRYETIEKLCRILGFRMSNAERRLRELGNEGWVNAVYHKKGYIKGWTLQV